MLNLLESTGNSLQSKTKSCLTCSLYNACLDPSKAWNYICNKYKRLPARNVKTNDVGDLDVEPIAAPKKSSRLGQSEDLHNAKELENFIQSLVPGHYDGVIEDGDVKCPPNFVDFFTDADFFDNTEELPFAKQIEIGANLFCDICWNHKCTDVSYARNIPTDATIDQIRERITFLHDGVCPKCDYTRADFWNAPQKKSKYGPFYELSLCAGQRGGKSALFSMIWRYQLARMLKTPDYLRRCKLQSSTMLHMAVTAVSFTQAKDSVFTPFKNSIETEHKWFSDYFEVLRHYQNKIGEVIFSVKDEYIQFRHRNLILYPCSPDMRMRRGATGLLSGIDEIGHLYARSGGAAVKLNADEVDIAMRRRLLTVRAAVQKLFNQGWFNMVPPLMMNISSPVAATDKIMRLVSENKAAKTVLVRHYTSFDMNPNLTPSVLEHERTSNPEAYMRDYEAQPPMSQNAFFSNKDVIYGLVSNTVKNAVHLQTNTVAGNRQILKSAEAVVMASRCSKRPKIMALDAGLTKNSFAGVVLEENDDDGSIIVSGIFEVIPEPDMPLSLHAIATDVLMPLIKDMNIRVVAADRWNSITILQLIEAECEIPSIQYSLKKADFLEFKNDVFHGNLILPKPELSQKEMLNLYSARNYPLCFEHKPVAHCLTQMLTVRESLKDVGKGDSHTDDIFRALVLAHRCLSMNMVQTALSQQSSTPIRSSNQVIGCVGSYSKSSVVANGTMTSGRFGAVYGRRQR